MINILTSLLVIIALISIKLSQCCGSTAQFHQKTIVVRRKNEPSDDLMFGSLLRENIVITAPHYLYGASTENVIVEANCFIISNKSNHKCIRRNVSEIIFENNYNFMNDIDSIAIIILKTPFEITPVVQLANFAKSDDDVDTYNCLYIKNEYYFSDRIKRDAIFFYGSFIMDAFDYQSKTDKTTLISKSSFSLWNYLVFKNKWALYKFVLNQNKSLNVFYDQDQKYLGTAIYCSLYNDPSRYVQVGVANYLFVVSYEKNDEFIFKELMYFINVMGREKKILSISDIYL